MTRAVVSTITSTASSFIGPCLPDTEPEPFTGDIGSVWRLVFLQVTNCGREALAAGSISGDELEAQEPFLFVGLPGLCMLEAVLRSERCPPEALQLVTGQLLTARNLPDGPAVPQLFAAMLRARQDLEALRLRPEEVQFARQTVLRAGADTASNLPQEPQGARRGQIMRLVSLFQGIATDISQLPFFRTNIQQAMENALSQESRPSTIEGARA